MKKVYMEPELEKVYFTFERIMSDPLDPTGTTDLFPPTDANSGGFSQLETIPEVEV